MNMNGKRVVGENAFEISSTFESSVLGIGHGQCWGNWGWVKQKPVTLRFGSFNIACVTPRSESHSTDSAAPNE